MQKPNGYDETRASGEFIPVNLGGHYAVVKQVAERQSSTGKDMIVIVLDFCAPDEQAGYFENQFNNDDRADKKWPYAGTKYTMVYDYNDPNKTSRDFKTFCTCIEKSNNYSIQWGGNNWAQQFKGKKIGVVYGEEETEYNGKISMRRIIRWFCSIDNVKTANIPAAKLLPNSQVNTVMGKPVDDGFMNISDEYKEEIPF